MAELHYIRGPARSYSSAPDFLDAAAPLGSDGGRFMRPPMLRFAGLLPPRRLRIVPPAATIIRPRSHEERGAFCSCLPRGLRGRKQIEDEQLLDLWHWSFGHHGQFG